MHKQPRPKPMMRVPQVACSDVACLEATHGWQDGLHAGAQLPEHRPADLLRRRRPGLSLRRQPPDARSSQDPCAIGPPAAMASHQQIGSALQRAPDNHMLCRIPGRRGVLDDDAQQVLLWGRLRPVRGLLWYMIPSRDCLASHLSGISGSLRLATGQSQGRVGGDPGSEQPRSQTHCDSPLSGSLPHRHQIVQQHDHRTDIVIILLAELTGDVLLARFSSIVHHFQGECLTLTQSGWGPGLPHMLAAGHRWRDIAHQVQTDRQKLIQTSGFLLQLCGFAC